MKSISEACSAKPATKRARLLGASASALVMLAHAPPVSAQTTPAEPATGVAADPSWALEHAVSEVIAARRVRA